MKLNTELVFAEMGEGFVAVPVGNDAKHIVIRLNSTGAEICRAIADGYSEEDIAAMLLKEYDDIDEKTAADAVQKVIAILKEKGLLEE